VDDNHFFFLLCLATSHRVATGIMGSWGLLAAKNVDSREGEWIEATMVISPLVICYIAIENGPFLVDLPIY
jgi:hypothetical protein